ncbi:MAG: hypothetical protein ACD_45C00570G0004 [uncultured bacterium]|nr:MAG: hypothetical protein ACD_45C00570G0004 [uncultured bacterium]OGT56420.1 MAG: ribosomal subunit interface protein [Gammaproteobacteria bacterium RIFCSPHIGHO2_12_FULL_42_10]
MSPVQITIKDVPASHVLEARILKKSAKLKHFFRHIIHCRIVVSLAQKHKQQGQLYSIHIDTAVPGKRFVITRKTSEDVYVAMRDAFKALERKLEEHTRKCQGRVKAHLGVLQNSL